MSTLLACSPAPVLSPGISSSITDATSEKHSSSEKKRKQRSVASLSSGGDISGPVQHSEEGAKLKKKSKKRKLESSEIADIAASSNFPAAGNGSPRTGQPDGDDATPAVSLLSHEDRTDKKRKKKRVHDAQGEDVGKADARLERKKKKKAEVTESQDIGVVDPRGDNTLSEQATKALSYAYLHHYDRKTWKFSKPRQIWLVKNLWSESQIPEKYTPLLAHYLASIQSNLRTKLTDTCNERLASNLVSTVPVDENSATISTETSVIRDRASAILRAMKPT